MTRALTVLAVLAVLVLTGCRDGQPPKPRPSYPRDGAEASHAITPTTVAVIPPARHHSPRTEAHA